MGNKKKYYAVKTGQTTGIFESWDECKLYVEGYPGAEYKSFSLKKEALAYMQGKSVDMPNTEKQIKKSKIDEYTEETEKFFNFENIPENTALAYVDGSYDIKTKRYSFGCAMLTKKDRLRKEYGVGENEQARTARNVAGELMGTMFAVKTAVKEGYNKLVIYHDYIGISKWYLKQWKAESFCAVEYIAFLEKYKPFIDIKFIKVDSHTGDTLNELADLLAKTALGFKV